MAISQAQQIYLDQLTSSFQTWKAALRDIMRISDDPTSVTLGEANTARIAFSSAGSDLYSKFQGPVPIGVNTVQVASFNNMVDLFMVTLP